MSITLAPFVGVVTHNPMSSLRFELLEQAVRSIEKAFPLSELFLLDNGSTDGSWEAVCEMLGVKGGGCRECGSEAQRGRWHVRIGGGFPSGNFTPGAGRHRLHSLMGDHEYGDTADARAVFWVMSDDDMLWRVGSEDKLRRFWRDAPEDIAILSGLLEPEWHWNTPREAVGAGGVRVLVRDSAPGAAWSFRHPRKILVGYGASELHRFGYDYESCKLLRKKGQRFAQIDLAEHLGWEHSTHGNEANMSGRPLDRKKWGV